MRMSLTSVRVVMALAVLLAFASFPQRSAAQTGDRPTQRDPCQMAKVDTATWKRVDAGPFSILIPPGYKRRSAQGIDSLVGRWEAGERRIIEFDWGAFSNDLSRVRMVLKDVAECQQPIGGYSARLIVGADADGKWLGAGRKLAMGCAWRNVKPNTHLTVLATSDDFSDGPRLVAIIGSVRFQ